MKPKNLILLLLLCMQTTSLLAMEKETDWRQSRQSKQTNELSRRSYGSYTNNSVLDRNSILSYFSELRRINIGPSPKNDLAKLPRTPHITDDTGNFTHNVIFQNHFDLRSCGRNGIKIELYEGTVRKKVEVLGFDLIKLMSPDLMRRNDDPYCDVYEESYIFSFNNTYDKIQKFADYLRVNKNISPYESLWAAELYFFLIAEHDKSYVKAVPKKFKSCGLWFVCAQDTFDNPTLTITVLMELEKARYNFSSGQNSGSIGDVFGITIKKYDKYDEYDKAYTLYRTGYKIDKHKEKPYKFRYVLEECIDRFSRESILEGILGDRDDFPICGVTIRDWIRFSCLDWCIFNMDLESVLFLLLLDYKSTFFKRDCGKLDELVGEYKWQSRGCPAEKIKECQDWFDGVSKIFEERKETLKIEKQERERRWALEEEERKERVRKEEEERKERIRKEEEERKRQRQERERIEREAEENRIKQNLSFYVQCQGVLADYNLFIANELYSIFARKDLNFLEYYFSIGGSPNLFINGLRPLTAAIYARDKDFVKYLVEHGATITVRDVLIAIDAYIKYEKDIDFLLRAINMGLDINSVDEQYGINILHSLIINANLANNLALVFDAIMDYKYKYNPDLSIADFYYRTPLSLACANNSSPIFISSIIDTVKTVDQIDLLEELHPIHIATENDNEFAIKSLVNRDARLINLRCQKNGYTPLHIASEKGNLVLVKLLLSLQADTEILDNSGFKAIQLAHKNKHDSIVTYLFSQRAIDFTPINIKSINMATSNSKYISINQTANFEKLINSTVDCNTSSVDTKAKKLLQIIEFILRAIAMNYSEEMDLKKTTMGGFLKIISPNLPTALKNSLSEIVDLRNSVTHNFGLLITEEREYYIYDIALKLLDWASGRNNKKNEIARDFSGLKIEGEKSIKSTKTGYGQVNSWDRNTQKPKCRYFNGNPNSCRYGYDCKFSHR